MPLAASGFRWQVTFATGIGTLDVDVPGAIAWTRVPVGRVATNPCTGDRTLILRGDGLVPPPDLAATIRIDPPASAQAAVQAMILEAWSTGATGTLVAPMTSVVPSMAVAIDPSQAPEARQEDGVLYISLQFIGMG